MPEIDLHGLTVEEAMKEFIEALNRAKEPLRVIHGHGSSGKGGVIRQRLRAFLEEHSDKVTWFDTGNPGVTLVQKRKPIPTALDQLAADILEYCETARTEEKIAGAFRKHSPREIKNTIRRLKGSGLLREVLKSGHKTYVR
jgi:hypothetical protein